MFVSCPIALCSLQKINTSSPFIIFHTRQQQVQPMSTLIRKKEVIPERDKQHYQSKPWNGSGFFNHLYESCVRCYCIVLIIIIIIPSSSIFLLSSINTYIVIVHQVSREVPVELKVDRQTERECKKRSNSLSYSFLVLLVTKSLVCIHSKRSNLPFSQKPINYQASQLLLCKIKKVDCH